MFDYNMRFSREITVFHGRKAPEPATLVGYGALIEGFQLAVPLPEQLTLISSKKRQYITDQWMVFTSRHKPDDTLYKHIVFALKYEGIQLLIFKKLFKQLSVNEVVELIQLEPLGQYSRRIWFLYEWLFQKKLPVADLNSGNLVDLVDTKLQFGLTKGVRSTRHRIINNLPGNSNFCPLIRKTPQLEHYISENLSFQKELYLNGIRRDIMQRASAFLLLKDSKASFTIEGESPKSKRATRWGQAIGQAGTNELNDVEFERLQQLVIENPRFLEMGYRKKGGFVGEQDRETGEPIPAHLSARYEDLPKLMNGLIETDQLLLTNFPDAILAAAVIAFGFVFIHPFQDGNGRVHRYLIHHVLAKMGFSQQGMIFPVSAAILNRIIDYQKVLEHYSRPLLDFIEWKETIDHNIEITNETIDYYRYFNATKQATFLYACVKETIDVIIPQEVDYLIRYEAFKNYMDNVFEMPDNMIALIVRFLTQNNGVLSKRAREMEFQELTNDEVQAIENKYSEMFSED